MTRPIRSGELPSHEEVRGAVEAVLGLDGADGVEVVFSSSSIGLTRFASSQIIQNTSRRELQATVKVAVDNRIASAATNQLHQEHLLSAGARALAAARCVPPDEEWPGLTSPQETGSPRPIERYDEQTAGSTPLDRAARVGTMLAAAPGASVAGFYETGSHAYAVLSSKGVDCYDRFSRCAATTLVDLSGATGWGEGSSHDCSVLDVEHVAQTAARKAKTSSEAIPLVPGRYTVVLEAPAVGTLLEFFAYSGFGAKQVIDKESWLAEHMGERAAAPSVTIADDARHRASVGIGFDFEGVAKKRVVIIDAGRVIGPVTDRRTARALGSVSSGHASGSDEFGPYAFNVVMEPGDKSIDELTASVTDGVLVTRFHYVNVLDRPLALLTGMTRDGTWRIRNGQVAEPLTNLRFTHSVPELLGAVTGVGEELVCMAPEFGSFGSTAVPALASDGFCFTSTTSH